MELDTTKIVQQRLSNNQFIQEEHPKKQIICTIPREVVIQSRLQNTFNKRKVKLRRLFVIGEKGTIVQLFSSKHWAYHLGLKPEVFAEMGVTYRSLDKISIGIEICNFGPLKNKTDILLIT